MFFIEVVRRLRTSVTFSSSWSLPTQSVGGITVTVKNNSNVQTEVQDVTKR